MLEATFLTLKWKPDRGFLLQRAELRKETRKTDPKFIA